MLLDSVADLHLKEVGEVYKYLYEDIYMLKEGRGMKNLQIMNYQGNYKKNEIAFYPT